MISFKETAMNTRKVIEICFPKVQWTHVELESWLGEVKKMKIVQNVSAMKFWGVWGLYVHSVVFCQSPKIAPDEGAL